VLIILHSQLQEEILWLWTEADFRSRPRDKPYRWIKMDED
jgi:hypothetical protein